MTRNNNSITELDMMLIRAGWPTTPSDLETCARRQFAARASCATCRNIAKLLERTATWFEARATKLESGFA